MNLQKTFRMGHGHHDGITIHSRGGIGNQLFSMLAGLALADNLKCLLYIDPSQHRYTPHLPFLLDQLIRTSPAGLRQSVACLSEPRTKIGRIIRKVGIPQWCDFAESSFRFAPDFFFTPKGSCAVGYFQSWRYLEHVHSERRTQVCKAISGLASNHALFGPRDIVIHVRRGDYLEPGVREVHGVLPYGYYANAISSLRRSNQSGKVWVISDGRLTDLHKLEQQIGTSVTQVEAASLWTDLQALIGSPSLVIANSTFSWIAGWLNQGRNVFAPQPWFFTDQYDTSDLIPPHWATVEHDFGD